MSEYPINCCECGSYLGLVHASEWSDTYICERCKKAMERERKEIENGK